MSKKNSTAKRSWLGRLFFGGSKGLADDIEAKRAAKNDVEEIVSPVKQIVRGFMERKLAVGALCVVIAMFLFVFIGPLFLTNYSDSYTEVTQKSVPPTMSMMSVPRELRGGYTGFWRTSDVLEFTSHGYDGFVFDENDNRIDFTGYRVDCITDFALEFLEQYRGEKPFFMTVSHIEPHHQNDHHHYEGPIGSKEKYANFTSPKDLEVLGGNHREEYPDYLGQCASLDKNLGRLVNKLKEMGIYEDTVIIYLADHGSHFMTRNQDAHLNGYDDYKRSMHDACLRVPLVVTGGEFTGGGVVTDLISTAGLPKTILGIAGVDVGDKMIGEDFADVLHKTDPDRPNEVFAQISESRVGRAIRTADYAYSVYAPGINGGAQPAADLYADDFFYDLKKDPYELNNLIDDPAYTQVKQELRKKLLKWIRLAENAEPEIVDG